MFEEGKVSDASSSSSDSSSSRRSSSSSGSSNKLAITPTSFEIDHNRDLNSDELGFVYGSSTALTARNRGQDDVYDDTFNGAHSRNRRKFEMNVPTRCIMHRKLILLSAIVILVIIIMAATLTKDKPTSSNGTHQGKSSETTPETTSIRPLNLQKFQRIKDRLLQTQISHASNFEDENSAQYKALVWIVRDDDRQLDFDADSLYEEYGDDGELPHLEKGIGNENDFGPILVEEDFLFQRYGLAVLWFQTTDLDIVLSAAKTSQKADGIGQSEGVGRRKTAEDLAVVGDAPPSDTQAPLTQNDIQWANSTNWLSSKGHCHWHGVKCHGRFFGGVGPNLQANQVDSEDDHVAILNLTVNNIHGNLPNEIFTVFRRIKVLDLGGNYLEGTVASEIGRLGELEDLNLASNFFDGTLPTDIGNMGSLFALKINDNRFAGNIPKQIGRLPNLHIASMFNNEFRGEIPPEIGLLKALVSLYLDSNRLTGQIPTTIGELTSIVDLRLRRNNFSGSIPTELGNLVYLESLYLDGNPQLSGAIPTELARLQRLDELHLYDNNLKGQLPTEFGLLKELTKLYLDSNELTGNIPEEWGGMVNLAQLFLAANKLGGVVPPSIRGMQSLRFFRLSDNNFVGNLPSDMSKMLKLEYVYLDKNGFSGNVPSAFGELSRLRLLHLHNNNLTGDMPQDVCRVVTSFFLHELTADCKEPNAKISCDCCQCL